MDGDSEKRGSAQENAENVYQPTLDEYIGRRITHRRKLLGWSMKQLAEAVGIRFQQIQKYECAANRVSSARLYELAQAMGVSVAYFFEGYSGGVSEQVALDRKQKLRASIGDSLESGMTMEDIMTIAVEASTTVKK